MSTVPSGAIKEHTCPGRTLPARPAARVPREPLPGWRGASSPLPELGTLENQARSSCHSHLPGFSQPLLGEKLGTCGFPVGKEGELKAEAGAGDFPAWCRGSGRCPQAAVTLLPTHSVPMLHSPLPKSPLYPQRALGSKAVGLGLFWGFYSALPAPCPKFQPSGANPTIPALQTRQEKSAVPPQGSTGS